MQDLLLNLIPNVMEKLPTFYKAIGDTLIMVFWSGMISFLLGLILGVMISVTKPKAVFRKIRGSIRSLIKPSTFSGSIPFIILLTGVMPLSRMIMGTAIGVEGAIAPLVFGTVPFFSRQIESALAEIDHGLIEAALSMGCSPPRNYFPGLLKREHCRNCKEHHHHSNQFNRTDRYGRSGRSRWSGRLRHSLWA